MVSAPANGLCDGSAVVHGSFSNNATKKGFLGKLKNSREIKKKEAHSSPLCETSPSQSKSRNALGLFFKAIKNEFSLIEETYVSPDQCDYDLRGASIMVCSAPFFGAFPPDEELARESLSALEPVFADAKCVNVLPAVTHDGTPLPGNQTCCSICLDDFSKGDQLKSLHCVHYFHSECIDRWLMVGHACPMCKALVL